MTIYRSFILRMRMFHTTVVEKIETHILCSTIFFKSCRLWDSVEKHCLAGEARDDNIAVRMRIACWIPKATHTCTHTHRICNTYYFYTATILRTLPFFLSWCFYCNGNFCHTYPTNALEVLIYVARLSLFHLIPIPHYCILPKDISVTERHIRPIVLRCMVLILFPPNSFGRPSYCIIGSNSFNKSKLTSFHSLVYENRSEDTVRSNC